MEATSQVRGRMRRHNNRSMRTTQGEFDNMDDEIEPGGNTQPPSRQKKPLNFNQAMSDFQTMFPHIDRNVIETVLRANDGVVQTTIDQLLVLAETTDTENATETPRLPDYADCRRSEFIDEPPPAYTEIENNQLINLSIDSPVSPVPMESTNRSLDNARNQMECLRFWNPPMLGKLPPDFLRLTPDAEEQTQERLPVNFAASQDTNQDGFLTDRELEQFLEDQKLALYLQNEEFIRQLRHDPDFVTSLEQDHREFMRSEMSLNDTASPVGRDWTRDSGAKQLPAYQGGAKPRYPATNQDDAAFRTKLRHMGHSTRKKFGKMAKKFGRKKPPKHVMHGASTTNLLEEDSEEEGPNQTGLEGIEEYQLENTAQFEEEEKDITRNEKAGRRLPTLPKQASPTPNDEPIVFYSEDNEFSYKND